VRPTAALADIHHETMEDGAPGPDEALQARQDFARVRDALAALPQDQREAVTNAYYLDMSQTDIADALGAPLGTVKSRVRLALKRLRSRLEDDHGG
jgi:RNA polymerase sigma-70 factor, ECF subfamily